MTNAGGDPAERARTHRRNGLPIVIASENRIGRIRRSVKRAFIVSNGQPITVRDILARAYPRLRRFNDWHRWSCRRALLSEGAIAIARMRFTRGRPNLWAPFPDGSQLGESRNIPIDITYVIDTRPSVCQSEEWRQDEPRQQSGELSTS